MQRRSRVVAWFPFNLLLLTFSLPSMSCHVYNYFLIKWCKPCMHETNSTSLKGEKEVTWESWRWGNYTSPLQSRKRELGTLKQLNIHSSNEMPPLMERSVKTAEDERVWPRTGFRVSTEQKQALWNYLLSPVLWTALGWSHVIRAL